MFAAFSPGSDFKRYYRGRMPRLALLVVIFMPLMYGALYLWAFWDPFGHVNKVPVALVNLDQGSEAMGQSIDAGTQVANGLIDSGQLDLHQVSEKEAADGLAHGEYGWTITIPENFSSSITSAATGDPSQAELIFTYDESNNYLNTVIGQDAAEEVINQVTAQVGQQVFEAVITGVAGELPKLMSAADGIQELNDGAQEANDGAQEIATNLATAADGSDELAEVIGEIADAADSMVVKAEDIINSSGITASEIAEAAALVTEGAEDALGILDGIQSVNDQASDDLTLILGQLDDAGLPDLAGDLQGVIDDLENSQPFEEIRTVFDDVQTGATIIANEMENPNSRVNVVLRVVEDGQIFTDLDKVQSGADELSEKTEELATGLGELSTGADQLAEGMPQLADGTQELSDGVTAALEFLPTDWSQTQANSYAKTLSDPVVLVEHTENPAKTFAYGFAPFFYGLALFVGSIIAWMIFTPLQSRPLAFGLSPFRTVLASYGPTFGMGILQALILLAVTYFGLGLKPEHVLGTALFMILMVAVFLAMIQMFNAVLGAAVGRVTTLAFLMIMLTSAGGIYPVATTSPFFQWIHPYNPMTYTVTGLRQMIMGGVDYRFWLCVAVLVGLVVVFTMISTWAARRNRQYNMDRLYPPIEV